MRYNATRRSLVSGAAWGPFMNYETLAVSLADGVADVVLNRPDKSNAMNRQMWDDIRDVMRKLDVTPEARVVVLSGAGKHFNAGIDLAMLSRITHTAAGPGGHEREELRRAILDLQDVITSLETCRKPALAAIHGACIGGGVDLICAADMRYCSADAQFVIKEIQLGFVADVGTLQRLPKLIGDSMARELCYTGRPVAGAEAKAIGFVNRCYGSRDELTAGVGEIARSIADKSPLAVRGTKEMLLYTRDHSVADSLHYMAIWNAALLQSDDLGEAFAAFKSKRPPKFKD
jgi:enoyl-CoA hydratase